MKLISSIWGGVALLAMLIAFFPLVGILNWFVVPFSAIGVVIGYLAQSRTGLVCSVVALALSAFRLMLGGGIF